MEKIESIESIINQLKEHITNLEERLNKMERQECCNCFHEFSTSEQAKLCDRCSPIYYKCEICRMTEYLAPGQNVCNRCIHEFIQKIENL